MLLLSSQAAVVIHRFPRPKSNSHFLDVPLRINDEASGNSPGLPILGIISRSCFRSRQSNPL